MTSRLRRGAIAGLICLVPMIVCQGIIYQSPGSAPARHGNDRLWSAEPTVGTGLDKGAVATRPLGAGPIDANGQVRTQASSAYGRLPMSFVPNEGQADGTVKFVARGPGYKLFLTNDEAVLALITRQPEAQVKNKPSVKSAQSGFAVNNSVRLRLKGISDRPQILGLEPQIGKSNFIVGANPAKWHTNITNYSKVKYKDIYPGIDLIYYGNQTELEYDFVVAPGAAPGAIRMALDGIRQRRLTAHGDLALTTGGGDIELHKPSAYQEIGGRKQVITSGYLLKGDEIGFTLGEYDTTRPLIIDPVVSYAGYLGGTRGALGQVPFDTGRDVAVDSAGNAYVAGETSTIDFPTTPGAFQTTKAGPDPNIFNPGAGDDIFITKVTPDGTALVYSTYLGGAGDDRCANVAIDSAGNAYVTGTTTSTDFPVMNAFQNANVGAANLQEFFLAKLSADGSSLLYSTYFGSPTNGAGQSDDSLRGLALDSAGNAYVGGATDSRDFPTTGKALQRSVSNQTQPAFILGFNTTLSGSASLIYGSYLYGNGTNAIRGVATDGLGNLYVAGQTSSSNFPTTPTGFISRGINPGIFVTRIKLNPATCTADVRFHLDCVEALTYSSYLSGSIGGGLDTVGGIKADSSGNIYVVGDTNALDFPTKNAYQSNLHGAANGFVAKFNSNGSGSDSLIYSTYFGGPKGAATDDDRNALGLESAQAIAIDDQGNAYITGYTDSCSFPLRKPFTSQINDTNGCDGHDDIFVAKFNPNAAGPASLVYSTYYGGAGDDEGFGIAVDLLHNVYVVGQTGEDGQLPKTDGSFRSTPTGAPVNRDNAFVAKFSDPTILGRITNPDGTPAAGVQLNLTGDPAGVRSLTTDANGFYDFGVLSGYQSYSLLGLSTYFRFGPESFPDLRNNLRSDIVGVCRLNPPTQLSARMVSGTQANLTWTDNDQGVTGYEIQRRTDTTAYATIGTISGNVRSFTTDGTCGAPHFTYRVRAKVPVCSSDFSADAALIVATEFPAFTTAAPLFAPAGKPYHYDALAQDPKGERVTYTLTQGPPGMTINGDTGAVDWTPDASLQDQSFPVSISASNGECNGTKSQTYNVDVSEIPPPGGFVLGVGQIVAKADAVFKVTGSGKSRRFTAIHPKGNFPDGTYKLGGNDIAINDLLHLSGEVIVTVSSAAATMDVTVTDGAVILDFTKLNDFLKQQPGYNLLNIPDFGRQTVFRGQGFHFMIDGNGEVTNLLQNGVATPLKAAGVPIRIDSAKLVLDYLNDPNGDAGIIIKGKLDFPTVPYIPQINASFDNLFITRKGGVRFSGQISVAPFELAGLGVRNVILKFMAGPDPTQDVFMGGGDLVTPAFEVAGQIVMIGGGLQRVFASIDVSGSFTGIPIPPFFNVTGGTIDVDGLRQGNFSLFLGVNLTIVNPEVSKIISLTNAGIRYTAPSKIEGTSDFRLLTAKAANATLGIDVPHSAKFGATITLLEKFPVFIGSAELGGGVQDNGSGGLSFFLEGSAAVTIQFPDGNGFPYDLIKARPIPAIDLPLTLLQADVAFHNNKFSANVQFPVIGKLSVAVQNANGVVQSVIGTNVAFLPKSITIGGAAQPEAIRSARFDQSRNQALLASLRRDRASMGGNRLEGNGLYVPRASVNGSQAIGTVTVPTSAPNAIIRLFGAVGAPGVTITRPDSTIITSDNAISSGATFVTNALQKVTYVVLDNPTAGTYQITANDSTQGPFVLDAFGANAPPVIGSLTAFQADANVTVNYNITDADDNVPVSLYYDTAPTGFHGHLIAAGLPASATGDFNWNTGDGSVASGEYFVYAVADDGRNAPVRQYAPTKIIVTDPNGPATPQNVIVQAGGANSLLVSWDANTEADLRGYQVRYAVDGGDGTVLTQVADAGRATSLRLLALNDNAAYRVSVVAYNQQEIPDPNNPAGFIETSKSSLQSAPITATTEAAQPPLIGVTSPAGGARVSNNQAINISWRLDNSANVIDQQVELSVDGGATYRPLALHLEPTIRNLIWDIPNKLSSSSALIRVTALDQAGNEGIATSTGTFSILSGTIVFGDLNDDGVIDASDLVLMANALAGNVVVTTPAADVFQDGQLNAADLVTLANYLAGNISSLPVVPRTAAVSPNHAADFMTASRFERWLSWPSELENEAMDRNMTPSNLFRGFVKRDADVLTAR